MFIVVLTNSCSSLIGLKNNISRGVQKCFPIWIPSRPDYLSEDERYRDVSLPGKEVLTKDWSRTKESSTENTQPRRNKHTKCILCK